VRKVTYFSKQIYKRASSPLRDVRRLDHDTSKSINFSTPSNSYKFILQVRDRLCVISPNFLVETWTHILLFGCQGE